MTEQNIDKPKRLPDFFGIVDLKTGKMAIWKNLKKENMSKEAGKEA